MLKNFAFKPKSASALFILTQSRKVHKDAKKFSDFPKRSILKLMTLSYTPTLTKPHVTG